VHRTRVSDLHLEDWERMILDSLSLDSEPQTLFRCGDGMKRVAVLQLP